MRIVHVVTLITPDGAFGGPVRVAVNQARSLQERGHDVEIVAASSGYAGDPPTAMEGVPLSLFPARRVLPGAGFSGLVAPGLVGWARSNLHKVDVLHVHAARDLITLPLARYALSRGTPYVLQPHGMIDPSQRALSRPLDAFATRNGPARRRRCLLPDSGRASWARRGRPGSFETTHRARKRRPRNRHQQITRASP